MRVAVTGATGFIGWHACERLRDAGWTVVAIARPGGRAARPPGVELATAPLEAGALCRACEGAAAIVHAAGVIRAASDAEYRRVNVEGARAAAEAARSLGARLVHISSLTAAGPACLARPEREDDPCEPITAYGRSKLASERVIAATPGLRWTVLRPAAVYGPRDHQFRPLFAAARRGLLPRLPNAASFFLTLVHAADLARAIERACRADHADGEVLFVGHPAPASLDDVLRAAAAAVGRRCRPLPVPFALMHLAAWLGVAGITAERVREAQSPGFVCSVARAERRLGFRAAIPLGDGFRETAAWYRAHGWLA